MGKFAGFVQQEDTLICGLLVENTSDTPIDADALPIFRVYGANGLLPLASGTCAFLNSGTITGATNASPIVVTSAAHGLTTGTRVTISGVTGNTGANGTFTITVVDANSFSLDGSTGTGAYVSGGTWHVTGAYSYSIVASGADGFQAGNNYVVLFTFALSSVQKGDMDTFQVC